MTEFTVDFGFDQISGRISGQSNSRSDSRSKENPVIDYLPLMEEE